MLTTPNNGKQQKNSIPSAFLNYRQFISVKLISHDSGKVDKIPCDINGRKIDAHDPAHWLTADEALQRPYSVGFVFTRDDPFWFIDLDKAVANGALSDFAQSILSRFPGAAWEVSTSGTGIHIFGSGNAGDHKSVKSQVGGKVEFYDWGRFVLIPDGPVYGDASLDFTPHLASFITDYGLTPDPAATVESSGPVAGSTGWQYTDDELIAVLQRMRGAEQAFGGGVTAWDLWTGNTAALASKWPEQGRQDGAGFDRSSADAALFTHLCFLTGKDYTRAHALFQKSALYRADKYEGKGHYRLERLISYAEPTVTRVYNIQRPGTDPLEQARINAAASWGVPGAVAQPVLPPPPTLPEPVPASAFIQNDPPPREWTVPQLVPHKQVTLMTGDGGTGKTTILLQLALASASMRSWFGQIVTPRRVLFISGEDEIADLHYRVHEIAAAMGVDGENFWLMSFEELADGEIAGAMRKGDALTRKPLFDHVEAVVDRLGISMVILDPTADLFGGDENDPRQAKQFINLLRQNLATSRGCTVILSAHPSKTAISTGAGYAGAVSWHNKVRSRMYFTIDENDDDARFLEHAKTNRGKIMKKIKVRWNDGIFIADGTAEKSHDDIDEIFMTILKRRFKLGLMVSPHPGRSHGPTVFAADDSAQGISKHEFEKSMMRLKEAEAIDFVVEGPPSRRRTHIIVV